MSTFLQFFHDTIAQWWEFLCDTMIPGTVISFATLLLFVAAFNVAIVILRYVISKKIGLDHEKGGGSDPNQIRFWK